MIKVTLSGLGEFASRRIKQLESIINPSNEQDKITRTVALSAIGDISHRIHEEGKASDGSQIGTYSNPYLKIRTGNYQNNKITRGKNKGNFKKNKAGYFTRGVLKGQPRPKFNRSDDKKVIVSLTKKLELSYAVKATEKGYGIGFIDASIDFPNYNNTVTSWDKSQYVEHTYGKPIFNLTKEEKQNALNNFQAEVKRRLNVH